MKANPQYTAIIRSIIRWTTGTAATAAILVATCSLFPLLSSFPAFSMCLCFAIYIGLQIALPPVDEEDDWVPVRSMMETEEEAVPKVQSASTSFAFPIHLRPAV